MITAGRYNGGREGRKEGRKVGMGECMNKEIDEMNKDGRKRMRGVGG